METMTPKAETEAPKQLEEQRGESWTKEEDNTLERMVERFGEKRWSKVSECIEGRSPNQCYFRWTTVLKPGLIKGPWSVVEDKILIKWVKENGVRRWSLCAQRIPGRSGKQCRERWLNSLNPEVKRGDWSNEEQVRIIQEIKRIGCSWSTMAKGFENRTENSIKNYFYSTVRKFESDKMKPMITEYILALQRNKKSVCKEILCHISLTLNTLGRMILEFIGEENVPLNQKVSQTYLRNLLVTQAKLKDGPGFGFQEEELPSQLKGRRGSRQVEVDSSSNSEGELSEGLLTKRNTMTSFEPTKKSLVAQVQGGQVENLSSSKTGMTEAMNNRQKIDLFNVLKNNQRKEGFRTSSFDGSLKTQSSDVYKPEVPASGFQTTQYGSKCSEAPNAERDNSVFPGQTTKNSEKETTMGDSQNGWESVPGFGPAFKQATYGFPGPYEIQYRMQGPYQMPHPMMGSMPGFPPMDYPVPSQGKEAHSFQRPLPVYPPVFNSYSKMPFPPGFPPFHPGMPNPYGYFPYFRPDFAAKNQASKEAPAFQIPSKRSAFSPPSSVSSMRPKETLKIEEEKGEVSKEKNQLPFDLMSSASHKFSNNSFSTNMTEEESVIKAKMEKMTVIKQMLANNEPGKHQLADKNRLLTQLMEIQGQVLGSMKSQE